MSRRNILPICAKFRFFAGNGKGHFHLKTGFTNSVFQHVEAFNRILQIIFKKQSHELDSYLEDGTNQYFLPVRYRFVLTCNDVIMWYFRMNFYKNYHEKFLRVKTETLLFILSSITDRFSSVITIRHSIRQRKLYVIEASFWKCFYSMGGFLSVFQARNI